MINLNSDLIPYFRELNKKQLAKIENISRLYTCKNGDVVFLQGELCQSWVIVYDGSFLTRKKDDEKVIQESVLLTGDSFDFKSTIKNNITSMSLEAIGDCSILIIDILGIRKIAQKSPIIVSLIKLQLDEGDSVIWEENLMKKKKLVSGYNYIVRKCFLWTILRLMPLGLITLICLYLLPRYKIFILSVTLTLYLIFYLYSKFSFLEINKETAFKKELNLFKLTLSNQSIPLEMVEGSSITYSNKLYKLLRVGELEIRSTTKNLILKGVYRPEKIMSEIDSFKFSKLNIDKAIEISTFKNLYSKENDLFCMENSLEYDQFSVFTFRKNIIYFLARALPAFSIFLITSQALFYLFNNVLVYLLNVPTVLLTIWHFWDWVNDRYAFEGDKVIDIEKRPFWGREERIVVDIFSVQSINKQQKHLFQILFNYGDIKVLTLGGEIIYPSINNPDKVIDNLYLVKKYYHSKKESIEKQERQEEFLNYTKYYQELSKK